MLTIITVLIVAGAINPWIFLPMVPMIIIFWYLKNYFLATSRDVKRLEGSSWYCDVVVIYLSIKRINIFTNYC